MPSLLDYEKSGRNTTQGKRLFEDFCDEAAGEEEIR